MNDYQGELKPIYVQLEQRDTAQVRAVVDPESGDVSFECLEGGVWRSADPDLVDLRLAAEALARVVQTLDPRRRDPERARLVGRTVPITFGAKSCRKCQTERSWRPWSPRLPSGSTGDPPTARASRRAQNYSTGAS